MTGFDFLLAYGIYRLLQWEGANWSFVICFLAISAGSTHMAQIDNARRWKQYDKEKPSMALKAKWQL